MTGDIATARNLRKRMTPEEVKLWVKLRAWRENGIHFRRQAPLDGYVIDFLCKSRKLIVEVDGSQHGEGRQLRRDAQRDIHFHDKGYRIVRLWNGDINRDADAAAETVLAVLNGDDPFETGKWRSPHPAARSARPPSPRGEGGLARLPTILPPRLRGWSLSARPLAAPSLPGFGEGAEDSVRGGWGSLRAGHRSQNALSLRHDRHAPPG